MSNTCFVYLVDNYEGGEIRKIFDSREKAEIWHNKMIELSQLWEKYHQDGTVDKWLKGKHHGSSDDVPECKKLNELAGIDPDSCNIGFVGEILEYEIE